MSPRILFRKPVRIVQIMQSLTHAGRDSESEMEPLCKSSNSKASKMRPGGVGLPRDVRHGYIAVYVGEERRRFVISTQYLNHRLFTALLKRSEEEFGFDYKGGLSIATCEPVLFEHLLWMIGTDDPSAKTAELDDLLEFYSS